jgi:hypothetical protein
MCEAHVHRHRLQYSLEATFGKAEKTKKHHYVKKKKVSNAFSELGGTLEAQGRRMIIECIHSSAIIRPYLPYATLYRSMGPK